MDWNLTYTKNGKDNYMINGTSKKIVDHVKLKLGAFLWGQGECEWPLVNN